MRSLGFLLAIAAIAPSIAVRPASAQQAYPARAIVLANRISFESATREVALKRGYDAKLIARAAEIDTLLAKRKTLRAQIAGERAQRVILQKRIKTLLAQLDALEQRIDTLIAAFNDALAAQNAQFAVERARWFNISNTMMSTPEAQAVLISYANHEPGSYAALMAKLDEIQQARAALYAEEVRMKTAADKREKALVAKDGWGRGDTGIGEVIARYRAVVALDWSQHWDWVELAQLYVTDRKLAEAEDAANHAFETARDDRDRTTALTLQGDVLEDRGNLVQATARYEKSVEIRRTLLVGDPASTTAQRDLSIALNKVGGLLMKRNDSAGALKYYEESLRMAYKLSRADRDSDVAKRDVAVTLLLIGNARAKLPNQFGAARMAYAEALTGFRELAIAAPLQVVAQRDLALALVQIGSLLADKGAVADARAMLDEALTINRQLVAGDRAATWPQRDLSVNLDALGDLLAPTDRAAALQFYNESLDIATRLLPAGGGSVEIRRDLALSIVKVGTIMAANNDREGAIARFEQSLTIFRELAAIDAGSADPQRDVLVVLYYLAEIKAPGYSWAKVKQQADYLRSRKMVEASDDADLAEIDRFAAAEARRRM